MKVFKIKGLLQKDGWSKNIFISVDSNGTIISIDQSSNQSVDYTIDDFVLPGFQNAHSHAFQYAMAGLAEIHDNHLADNFWSWREAMYRLALTLNPDQIEAIATMLYAEMVRHGYTNVAEFHYLHHDVNGKKYQNHSEIGERIIAAAKTAKINITLVPIFYQKGGFGQAPSNHQKRFISKTSETYLQLLEASQNSCNLYKGANIGLGIHSIRAVESSDIISIAQNGPSDLPFHIHVSEQLKEINDSIEFLGKRPVEFLLENLELDARFHLVHATHLTDSETIQLAKSKANVVLCPTTEGNLGDGLFPFELYKKHQGAWSIGTDSHIGISPFEELRLLDYGQRLTTHQRNTFITNNELDSGQFAINKCIVSGRKAMGNNSDIFFKIGDQFNAVVIDSKAPLLACTGDKYLTSTILYSSDNSNIKSTIVNGEIINHSENENYLLIKNRFVKTMNELKSRF